jgi:hypothetical protein
VMAASQFYLTASCRRLEQDSVVHIVVWWEGQMSTLDARVQSDLSSLVISRTRQFRRCQSGIICSRLQNKPRIRSALLR